MPLVCDPPLCRAADFSCDEIFGIYNVTLIAMAHPLPSTPEHKHRMLSSASKEAPAAAVLANALSERAKHLQRWCEHGVYPCVAGKSRPIARDAGGHGAGDGSPTPGRRMTEMVPAVRRGQEAGYKGDPEGRGSGAAACVSRHSPPPAKHCRGVVLSRQPANS